MPPVDRPTAEDAADKLRWARQQRSIDMSSDSETSQYHETVEGDDSDVRGSLDDSETEPILSDRANNPGKQLPKLDGAAHTLGSANATHDDVVVEVKNVQSM